MQRKRGSERYFNGPSSLWSEHLVKVPLVDRASVPLSHAPVGGGPVRLIWEGQSHSVQQRIQENMTPREESYFGINIGEPPPLRFTIPSRTGDTFLTAADLH